MLWVLPPFIALALCLILAISARVSSAAAAQQASALVTLPLILDRVQRGERLAVRGQDPRLRRRRARLAPRRLALWRASRALSRERLLGMGA